MSLPAERLLVFDVREGWEPLCRFLGVDVPAGEPFPHLNDAKAIRQTMERLVTEGTIDSPFSRRE
ncbi:sulfotransferase [Nonomuraea sp. B19D2]|uniref:sulfotransferase n=1 Tax=Nonomuraea sp. B19D2 TaxID=3159561 RepID=UPI0032DB2BF2